MESAIIVVLSVMICLVVVQPATGTCTIPLLSGPIGDCSSSSAAEIHFNSSINHATCFLFGDLDFSNSTPDSWPDITATCIEGSSDLNILSKMTVSGQGRPLTAAQCQTYTDEQTMQCRIDCLLSFLLVIPNNVQKSGYIHLRAISCNQTLFTTSLNTIFNNANNIQPSFTLRSSAGMSTSQPAPSAATSPPSSSSPSPSSSLPPIILTDTTPPTQQPSVTPITSSPAPSLSSISSSSSINQPLPSPSATPPTCSSSGLTCDRTQSCTNSHFAQAHAAGCNPNTAPVVVVEKAMLLTTSDDVLDCLSLSIKDRLFSVSQICTGNGRPVLKNVTCDCSNCLSGSLSPSPSSCTASCFLWFEEDGGSSTFLLIKNLAGDMAYQILMQLTKKTCRQEYNLPQDVTSNCCTSEPAASELVLPVATASAGVLIALVVILLGICCCCCVRNRHGKVAITGDKKLTVSAVNPGTFSPTSTLPPQSPCDNPCTMELGLLPQSPAVHNNGVKQVIDKWRKIFKHKLLSTQDITKLNSIGEGAFGQVYRGMLQKRRDARSMEHMQVAIKTLKNAYTPEEVDEFIAESAIMLDFDHPNVLHLVGVCFDTEDQLPLIVLPYMANGDLKSFLKKKRQQSANNLPEGISINVLLDMCLDIATGMEYLANNKFVHRDLAARNCMVNESLEVKVADFGLSRDMYTRNYYRMESRRKLPIKWMAPECLNDTLYNEMTDVWSFGITCWEVFSLGKTPYASIDNPDILDFIVKDNRRLTKPSFSPQEMWILMSSCWQLEPSNRPTFSRLKQSIQQICTHYRYQTVKRTHDARSESPVCSSYAHPYLLPDQQHDSSEGETSDSSSSPSAAQVAAAESNLASHRLSEGSRTSGDYNHLSIQNSSNSSGVHFNSSMEVSSPDATITDNSYNVTTSSASTTIPTPSYSNVVLLDPTDTPTYINNGPSLAERAGRHSIATTAPHHYFMLDPEAVNEQRTLTLGRNMPMRSDLSGTLQY